MDTTERLEIDRACRELVLRAARCVDAGDAAGLAQLFAVDGVLVRPNAQPLQGRDAIQAVYAQRPAERMTRHLVTNTLVEVESPTSARALSYVLLWTGSSADPDGPQGRRAQGRQLVGEFEDRFTREPEGWRIKHRDARFVLHIGD
ncbi:nuclear transport factor 2 family protein [Azohydromonas caseinilytica]|uniref:Nuclear transport factor 2 family protein n=1 Tax=Azohydromonas caseinilytica TaxID=2728836 RepID=A0A848FKN8_9BURK|nr:nuclear transport factor 2 family protein [Azohydromonas caseinilytica]NML18830.1 nuclear transport factor 2 family protein [Azohydromonas caseinilytica]